MSDRKKGMGLVLAGGYSSRAHGFKLLMEVEGQPVIERLIDAISPYVTEIILVTGFRQEEVVSWADSWQMNHKCRLNCVYNEQYAQGMFTSVQRGAQVIWNRMQKDATITHAIMTPGDYPCIIKRTVEELIDHKGDVVIPSYHKHAGHPIVVSRPVISTIIEESPDSHLKKVLQCFDRHYVDVNHEGILLDVDTPEQMRRAREYALQHKE